MKTLREVQDFMYAHQPVFRNWPKDVFEAWTRWYFQQGFISLVLNVDESIVGLAAVKPVMHPGDALDPNGYDPEGNCLYVAEVICTARNALKALGFAVLKRFGMRELVAWQRPPFYILEVHKASALRRNLFRMEVAHGPVNA